MGLTHVTAARNAAANGVVDLLDVGAGANAVIVLQAGVTDLVSIAMAAKATGAFGNAAAGVATANSLPRTGTAGAAGTADSFEARDCDGNVVFSGTVSSVAAGTGDIQLDNTSIALSQEVSLNTCTYTGPT